MGNIVVISRCLDADPAKTAVEEALIGLCRAAGLDTLVTPHLYHLPEESPVWDRLRAIEGGVTIAMWLHPRPAEWLARRHGLDGESLAAVNLGAYPDAEGCFAALREHAKPGTGAFETLEAEVSARWYPVVEMARCIHCQHCLQFCLFGVHTLDAEGQVRVTYPDNCKPGCPACSRICPEGAIMFPLYARDEAIAGAPGLLMHPDADARRMYYQRTGKTCPKCGSKPAPKPLPLMQGRVASLLAAQPATGNGFQIPTPPPAPAGPACEECGRPLPAPTAVAAPTMARPAPSPVRDELDELLDELDDLTGSRP